MQSEKQYIDLYGQCRDILMGHSAEPMNAVRDAAFSDFRRLGFPTKKVERYKYTDIPALFEPDYGLNLNRLEIPVDPYEAFRCRRFISSLTTAFTARPCPKDTFCLKVLWWVRWRNTPQNILISLPNITQR